MRRMLHLCALLTLAVVWMGVSAASAGATVFVVNECARNAAVLDQYVAFIAGLRAYQTDVNDLHPATATVVQWLAAADMHVDDVPLMQQDGQRALDALGMVIQAEDRISFHHETMTRALERGAFGTDQAAKTAAIRALAHLEQQLAAQKEARRMLREAAVAYLVGDREIGNGDLNSSGMPVANALNGLSDVAREIAAALQKLSAGCRSEATPAAPMSPTQIDRASGGGGNQRAAKQSFSATAPKRLKLATRGRTSLPLTLKQSALGQLQISLTRGKSLITGIQGSMGGSTGSAGLIIKLPPGTRAGGARLRLTFTPSGAPGKTSAPIKVEMNIRLI